MVRKYFGTDGIRGRANGEITPELALKVGQAAGLLFQRGDHRHRVVIGKDTRLSGYMIETALVAGFTSVGMDVLLLGPMPTPAVAMLTRSMRADIGVMISASHNLYDDNGIKLFGPDGYKLSDDVEREIEKLIESDVSKKLAKSADLGRAKRIDGVQDRYIEFAKRTLPRDLVARRAARRGRLRAWRRLQGRARRVMGTGRRGDSDRASSPTATTSTRNAARPTPPRSPPRSARCAPISASRSTATPTAWCSIDGAVHVIDGDQLLAVIAESWKDDGRLSKPGIVATVMSNLGLERHLKTRGIALIRTPVGDRYVLEQMREHGFNVGGEQSGHIILSDYATTGDGLVAALAGACGGEKAEPAGVGGLPPFRAAAASAQECPLQKGQAAGRRQRQIRHHQRRKAAERQRPPRDPALRHRTRDPGDGRGRRSGAGRGDRRRDRRRAQPGGGLSRRCAGKPRDRHRRHRCRALAIHRLALPTRLRFLFERPDAFRLKHNCVSPCSAKGDKVRD